MVKAHEDLDMNGNDIENVNNSTATTQHRTNNHFDTNGSNGLTQTIVVTMGGADKTFTFKGGILTAFDGGKH